MKTVNFVYIDDSTSRYMKTALNQKIITVRGEEHLTNCYYIDWDGNNSNELERLKKLIYKENINIFFIDSALYGAEKKQNRFLGIWLAYYVTANIPRAHIAIVSSRLDSDNSYVTSSFHYLNKITKDTEQPLLDEYFELMSKWVEDDIIFNDCCKEFEKYNLLLKDELSDTISFSLTRMESKESLSKEDFKEIIALLEKAIEYEK